MLVHRTNLALQRHGDYATWPKNEANNTSDADAGFLICVHSRVAGRGCVLQHRAWAQRRIDLWVFDSKRRVQQRQPLR